jgi:enamine deaminase RidA (YjgF/YER057c/UK114 family)
MKIERHETGPRMSKAVIHSDTVYLAGIVADSPKGKSMAEQTSNILSQIDGFLAMAGTKKTKLLSANIWISDHGTFRRDEQRMGRLGVAGQYAGAGDRRGQTRVADYKVEIMVVAAR